MELENKIIRNNNQLNRLVFRLYTEEENRLYFENALIEQEIKLTPENGWEGKNAEMRQAAKDLTLAGDIEYQNILHNLRASERNIRHTEVFIQMEKNTRSMLDRLMRAYELEWIRENPNE